MPTPDPQPAFRALSDPTRRAILALLVEGDLPLSVLAGRFAITRPAVRKHLAVLEGAGLIAIGQRGRRRHARLRRAGLIPALAWAEGFEALWHARLGAAAPGAAEAPPRAPGAPARRPPPVS